MSCNANPLTSQRPILNILQHDVFYYGTIDHYKLADGALIGPPHFGERIDAQGWPNDPALRSTQFNGGGIRLPNTDDYGANAGEDYIIDWAGAGEFTLSIGTWTVVSQTNVTQVGGTGSGHFKNAVNTVSGGSVRVNVSGLNTPGFPNFIVLNFLATDPGAVNLYIKSWRIYRAGDAGRLASGKMFRLPFLQAIVDFNPSAMRFMDWLGGNDDQNCRWENRCHPDYGTYWGAYTGPGYGPADYVLGTNTTHQYTLAASAGTAGNPKVTSATPTHGEVVTTQITSGVVRAGTATVTAITNSATPIVQAAGHPFIAGDTVYHSIPTATGMQLLDRRKCHVIAPVTANSYGIDIDTSGFATFNAAGGGNAKADFYVSLKLGSWADYPILFSSGFLPPTTGSFGGTTNYFQASGLYSFWFDKNIAPMNDSSGNPINGAWLYTNPSASQFGTGPQTGVPIEACTQLVIEANELAVSQGINNPIHMWLNCPFRGMLSSDPDYSSGSNFATNMVDVALNGSTVNGVTYRGLKAITGPSLVLELSNELWNTGGADTQAILQIAYGQAVAGKDNYNEVIGVPSLRSVQMVKDVKGVFPGESRLKYVCCCIGTNTGIADAFITAGPGTYYNIHKPGGWGSPISEHDAFGFAPYLDPFGNINTYTETIYDDNAKFNGADNSGTLSVTATAQTFTCGASSGFTVPVTSNIGSPIVGMTMSGSGSFGTRTLVSFTGTFPNFTLTLDGGPFTTGGEVWATSNIGSTAVSNGPVVVGQILVGNGVPQDAFVTIVSGVSPNYTLSLSQGTTIAANTVLTSVLAVTVNASSTNVIVTTAANGTVSDGQRLVGTGVPANTFVAFAGVAGTFPNYTLTLTNAVSVSGGTVLHSHGPRNNYIGAADPNTAIQSFVDAVRGVNPVDTTFETVNRYCDPSNPTAGVEQHYVGLLGGKALIHYEGGANWDENTNSGVFKTFMAAVIRSSQWGTAEINYWNARGTLSNVGMPALYGWIRGTQFATSYKWAYASPDNYASHIEGQNLKNAASWVAFGARNQAFNECGAAVVTGGGRGTHLKMGLHLH